MHARALPDVGADVGLAEVRRPGHPAFPGVATRMKNGTTRDAHRRRSRRRALRQQALARRRARTARVQERQPLQRCRMMGRRIVNGQAPGCPRLYGHPSICAVGPELPGVRREYWIRSAPDNSTCGLGQARRRAWCRRSAVPGCPRLRRAPHARPRPARRRAAGGGTGARIAGGQLGGEGLGRAGTRRPTRERRAPFAASGPGQRRIPA